MNYKAKVIYLDVKNYQVHVDYLDFIPQEGTYIYPRNINDVDTLVKDFPYRFIVSVVDKDEDGVVCIATITDESVFTPQHLPAKENDYRSLLFQYLHIMMELSLRDAVSELPKNEDLNSVVSIDKLILEVDLKPILDRAMGRLSSILLQIDSLKENQDGS